MNQFFNKTFVQPLIEFLKQGLSPKKLSLCIALGFALGTFPIIGSTTLLCTAAAFAFRLNMPAIQLINYFSYPLQLLLFIPFIRIGEFLFHQQPMPIDLVQIYTMLQTDLLGTIQSLWWVNMRAIVAWSIFAFPTGVVIYFGLVLIFTHITQNK